MLSSRSASKLPRGHLEGRSSEPMSLLQLDTKAVALLHPGARPSATLSFAPLKTFTELDSL